MNFFVIAELSANHNNNIEIAKKSIMEIAKTKADSVKLQTYTPLCLTLPFHNEYFKIKNGLWKDQYYYDLYSKASTPWEWHEELFSLARSLGLVCFSSPFSVRGVEFLESLACPIYKIASFEVAHIELLKAIAKTKKPVILSLGIANKLELNNALSILKNNEKITLLHCISEYPANFSESNLSNLIFLQQKYKSIKNIDFGLSDHTLDNRASIIALSLGARVIEKHFILDKNIPSPDSAFSLDSREFCQLINDLEDTKKALNNFELKDLLKDNENFFKSSLDSNNLDLLDLIKEYSRPENSKKGREYSRSLFIKKDIKRGESFSLDNIACVRPNLGISPLFLDFIINKKSLFNLKAGSPLKLSDIDI